MFEKQNALAELKAGTCIARLQQHHTLCEWNSLELCNVQPTGPNVVAPRPDTDWPKGKRDISPHNRPKELRETECPLVVENSADNFRSLAISRTDTT